MADQDFNIKVVTTADTSGLRQTRDEIEKTRQAAEKARQDAGAANLFARIPPKGSPTEAVEKEGAGLTGTAVGLGTIVTLLTTALNKWKEFNAEQDRWVDGMIKAEEKARSLGLAIVDMQDKARSAARIDMEPLQQSFERLTHDAAVLKTEIQLAFQSGDYEGVKKLVAALGVVESQFNRVTTAIDNLAAAKRTAAQSELEKRVPGLKPDDQVKEADLQTQRILQNEQAAAAARAAGNEKDADLFQKSADAYTKSATPKQLEDLKRIHDLQNQLNPPTPATPYRQPQPGEPGGGEVSPEAKAGLIGDAAKKARETELENTRKAGEQAQKDRESANDRLREKMLGQTPATQTKEDKTYGQEISAKLDTLIGLFR